MPSSLYFVAMAVTALTNFVRFAAEPTLVEKNRDPVHPPSESDAFTP